MKNLIAVLAFVAGAMFLCDVAKAESMWGDTSVLVSPGGSGGGIYQATFRTEALPARATFEQRRAHYRPLVRKYLPRGVPMRLADAMIQVESGYQARIRGGAHEYGLMQIKCATARGMGFRGRCSALLDPETNIKWGMEYLAGAHRLARGDTCGTVLRYNAGHGARRMNRISARYCRKVQGILRERRA